MRVLVTGGAAILGLSLPQLLERGDRVRVVDRFFFGAAPLEALAVEHPGQVEIVTGDLRAWDDAWLDGVDGVSHLAGLSNDPTAEYNPDANWQHERHRDERLVKRVSAARCDGWCSVPPRRSTTHRPGMSTNIRRSRRLVRTRSPSVTVKRRCCDSPATTSRRRFCVKARFTVTSPRMRFDLVVNTFVRDAITRQKLFLHGGGWQWRPLVDVSDVARAHIIVLDAPLAAVGGEIFNSCKRITKSANLRCSSPARCCSSAARSNSRCAAPEDRPRLRMTNLKMTQRPASLRRSPCSSRSTGC